MIFENLKPRLEEAIKNANDSKQDQEVKLIYNELCDKACMNPVMEFCFSNSIDFSTRHDEFRFVIIIHPKSIL